MNRNPKNKFKAGNKAGAKGRTPAPAEVIGLRNLDKRHAHKILTKFCFYTLSELEEARVHPMTTALELMVISIIMSAIRFGDPNRLNFIFDRTIGKALETPIDPGKEALKTLDDEQIYLLLERNKA